MSNDDAESNAKIAIDKMIEKDPSKAEVVAMMRSRGRSWTKIFTCFRLVGED